MTDFDLDSHFESENGGTPVTSFIIPSSPADRKKIMDAMNEVSACKTRIEGEREYIKETIDMLSKDFKIPKKHLNRLAKVIHKQNFAEEQSQDEEFQTLVEAVTKQQN